MKRHLLLLGLRLLLTGIVSITLPVVFTNLGPEVPDHSDGQQILGLIVAMWLFNLAVGTGYFIVGTIFQILLRRKPVKWTLLVDLPIFAILTGLLTYAALSAQYVGF